MNRGVLQSSPVQQMMSPAGNPSWWNINNLMRPPIMSHGLGHHHHHHHYHQLSPSYSSTTTTTLLAPPPNNNNNNNNNNNSSSSSVQNNININDESNLFQAHHFMNINMSTTPSSSSWLDDHTNSQDHHNHTHLPESWSQLLMGTGVCIGEEEDEAKKIERWENQMVMNQQALVHHHVKQETSSIDVGYNNSVNLNVYANHEQNFQLASVAKAANNWPSLTQMMDNNNNNNSIPASSPQSCVTTNFSSSNCNSVLDFTSSKSTDQTSHPASIDQSSECNSTSNGGTLKKAKVQPSSSQSTFKVRKEKLGDRITALHQLVSPFGKTDTASVLLEAIGYIRFLQSQIEALSLPYLSSGAGNKRQPHPVQGERSCIFPEDPGQLLNDNCLKRKGGPDKDSNEEAKDLRSRGLCLVPVSCTLHVGSDNGADYWAPALGGGFR